MIETKTDHPWKRSTEAQKDCTGMSETVERTVDVSTQQSPSKTCNGRGKDFSRSRCFCSSGSKKKIPPLL